MRGLIRCCWGKGEQLPHRPGHSYLRSKHHLHVVCSTDMVLCDCTALIMLNLNQVRNTYALFGVPSLE